MDTLAYAKALQKAGVAADQAEAHASALNRAVQGNVATKTDIAAMETRLVKHVTAQIFTSVALNAALTAIIVGAAVMFLPGVKP